MKKPAITAILISLIITSGILILITRESKAEETEYRIMGHGPAGGWIFYDKGYYSDGWRYLEVGLDQKSDLRVTWGCAGKSITGAKSTSAGTGKTNTEAILKGCAEKETAVKLAVAYRGGGKSDWFLPSRDELHLLIELLSGDDVIGGGPTLYWSSSESGAGTAWAEIYNGETGPESYSKAETGYVLPVRAF